MNNRNGVVNVLAIQSYDWIDSEKNEGAGSIARIRAACNLVREGHIPEDSLVVYPQGYSKENPLKKGASDEYLGLNMRTFTERQKEMVRAKIVSWPMSWGTMNDLIASYRIVVRLGYDTAHFHFVTDPVHLRRVKLAWWLTHPQGWTAEFHPVIECQLSAREKWSEIVKITSYFFQKFPGLVLFGGRPVAEQFRFW
jgi:hypothetical protein